MHEEIEPDEIARRIAEGKTDGPLGSAKWVQTHISHVFLTADRVYKIRKAVEQPFLDFSSRALRNLDAERELHLNRRLAPDVYLGIAPIEVEGRAVRLCDLGDRAGDAHLEHAVVMRRLPSGRDALALLEAGRLVPEQLERIAVRIARFHREHGLGAPAPWSAAVWLERTAAPALACITEMASGEELGAARVKALDERLRARLDALRDTFEARRRAGCAVDGHGDLHLDHVWFEGDDDPPQMIDCLEFDEDLRRIDRASEVAFLSMDLAYRERADLADAFLSAYASETDDYGLFDVVDFFAAYRALVRAKVAGIASTQPTIEATQRERARASLRDHVALAERLLAPAGHGGLVVLCGTVGCGKSSVARRLTREGQGITIASDRVRKREAGLEATDRIHAGPNEGLYTPEKRTATYHAMLVRARAVVESGRTAILDASFTRRADRDLARAWAEERGLSIRLIEVQCDAETARERLVARAAEGRDPSDAGPDFLPRSLAAFEPPQEWPMETHEVVRT